jgi:transposase
MRDNDGRRLGREAQKQLRISAVKRVLAGESPEAVIKSLGYQRCMIYRWLAQYRAGGFEALDEHKSSGRPPILAWNQMYELYKIVVDETPEQYKFPFALWTIEIVRAVIKRKFGLAMSPVSAWRTLRALGLTAQKPKRRAYQQNPQAVKQFLHEEYPDIKRAANECGAKIYWGDEASVRSDYHSGTTWGAKGETPVVKTTGARYSVNMISAICGTGEMRFMANEKRFNSGVFIKFLKRLMRGEDAPVFLIVDGHPSHKSKMVKEFVAKTEGKLTLFILPGYSPDLNPDELVWGHIKHQKIGRQTVTGPEQFKKLVYSALQSLSRQTKMIRSFFHKPSLLYAAV